MKINQAEFIVSVASADKFLKTDKPIIAVAGKSNVGKSSLINMLANRKKLAKTSVTPGRTRLINYFDFGEFILADLPGYGFAKVSKEEKKIYMPDTKSSSESKNEENENEPKELIYKLLLRFEDRPNSFATLNYGNLFLCVKT